VISARQFDTGRVLCCAPSMAVLDALQAPSTLPQSEESERAVLAGILLEPEVLPTVSARLVETDFYFERHQRIYRAMLDLQAATTTVDLRTLQARLEQQGHLDAVGGLAYLAGLDVDLPDLGRIDSYVEIVKERSLRRRLIQACTDVTRSALDGGLEAGEALGRAEQAILSLGDEAVVRGFVALGRVLDKTMEDIEERPGSTLIGVPTGFTDLDRMTHGLNRGNLIIIAGRPGMGKCLSADAELVEADGAVHTIAEIVERQSARLLTLNAGHRFEWTSPSVFVDDGVKPVFEVTTRLGRRIKVTASHPFLTLGGWKPLRELQVGDSVGVPRRLEAFGSEPLGNHKARLLGYLLGDGGLTGSSARFTNVNSALRDDFINAVEHFGGVRVTAADSSGTRATTLTVVADEDTIAPARTRFAGALDVALRSSGKAARTIAAAAGVSPASVTGWRQGRFVPSTAGATALATVFPELTVPDAARHNAPNALTRWLADAGLMGCGAYEKFVPAAVFRAPQADVRTFLNRLFATDGWVSTFATGQVQVGYCSCSERLARQVQHLLLRFGVVAALRRRKVHYRGEVRYAWQLEITEASAIAAFLDDIGAFGKERAIRRARAALRGRRRNPNRDVLPPAVWEVIDRERAGTRWPDLARRLGLGRGYNLHHGTRAVSRDRLQAIARALDSEALGALADSELFWDRITEIRYAGDEQVYDLTIPDTHNFVANDICVHNTSLALNIAQYIAIHQNKPVGVFSLEMSEQELALRILCSEADVSFSRLRSGHLSQKQWQTIVQTVRRLSPAPLYIDDSPNPSLLEIASKTRRLRAELGLELIILDYLQLMQAGGRYENRNLEIAAISRGLKQLAKELDMPVIALSQLSRQPERRSGDHRPQLADLRESGSIEQDADLVAFVYRDEMYNPDDPSNRGLAELILAKHRNGETGTVELVFLGETTTFKNRAPDSFAGGAPHF
jgi:replicative DNA helicase